jgi:hypothetical protein
LSPAIQPPAGACYAQGYAQDYEEGAQPGIDDDQLYHLSPWARRVVGPRGRKLMQGYAQDYEEGSQPGIDEDSLYRLSPWARRVVGPRGRKLMKLSPEQQAVKFP